MKEDDENLSFADLSGAKQRETATASESAFETEDEETANYAALQRKIMARPVRLERTTPSSAS